ncbi:amidohydrolase family protein [Patescibacteria group bacterium]
MKFKFPLINAHAHSAMIAFRGQAEDMALDEWLLDYIWPWEKEKVNPSFVYQNTKAAIQEMKKNGIRAFADMYFFEEEVGRAAEEEKIYAVIGEVIIDFPTPSAKSPVESLEITKKLINKFKDSPYVRVAVAPHSIDTLSKEYLLKAKDLASKHGLRYHIHCSETEDQYDDCLIKHGCTPVGYLEKLGLLDEKTLLVHCVYLSQDDLEVIKRRKAKVIHCPLSNLKLGLGVSSVAKILKKGITVALGTDGAASSNRLDIWEAGKFAGLLQKGLTHDPANLPAKQVIEMMTVNGMEALGFEEIDGRSAEEIKKAIDKESNFNYLYELNVNNLEF